MLGWIILLFLAMPVIELFLLIEIGQRIGVGPTLAIVIGTGLLGGLLVRWQGLRAWRDVIGALREGRVPTVELVAGALFLAGAAMLLTPGVITDAFGFAMMVPFLRRALARFAIGRARKSDRVQAHVHVGTGPIGSPRGKTGTDAAEQGYDLDAGGYIKEGDEEGVERDEDAA